MRKGLIESIEKVITSEEDAAIKKFPLFNSTHEGYAVIKEEIEEAEKEFKEVTAYFEILWDKVKTNGNALSHAEIISRHATLLACEAVQVAAMANKFIESIKSKSDTKRCSNCSNIYSPECTLQNNGTGFLQGLCCEHWQV